MTVYLLDSDHVSLHQRDHPGVLSRLRNIPPDSIFVPAITLEEQMRGWLAVIRRAKEPDEQAEAYRRLLLAHRYFCKTNIMPFTPAAASEFHRLRRAGLRIGPQDLRIAAAALCTNATLVTRNRRDFSSVPGLGIEDWTTSP